MSPTIDSSDRDVPAESSMRGLSIGKLAKAAKVSIHTIRFYEKSGLLPQPTRRPSGFREYSELDVFQLKFVREARLLGFSLEEIAGFLALEDGGSSAAVRAIVGRKLKVIDERIDRLQQWRQALQEFAAAGGRSKRRFLFHFFRDELAAGTDAPAVDSSQALKDSDDEG